MSISINTADYIKTKTVVIDGVEFQVRQLTSSEYVAVMALAEEFESVDKNDYSRIADIIKRTRALYVSVFTPQKKAEKILGSLEFDAITSIYTKIYPNENEKVEE